MEKITLEIYLPAALQSYDIQAPASMPISQLTVLAANALSQLSNLLFSADESSVLCSYETGKPIDIDMTIWGAGLRNGSKLMLV